MKENTLSFRDFNLNVLDSETPGRTIIFAHANGYSAGCYKYYHQALQKKFRIIAFDFVGHGKSESTLNFSNWLFFRDQLLEVLKSRISPGEKAIGIGHSLGGASTLLSCKEAPELFEKAIVLDPVVLGFRITTLAKIFGNPLAKVAKKRRKQFQSIELVRRAFRNFPAFANWEESVFQDYLDSCLRPTGNKKEVELCCDPEVEARIFSLSSYRVFSRFHGIKTEVHVAIPEKYEVCSPRHARLITKRNPLSSVSIWKDATHFFPFELPAKTLEFIESKL
ncbi:alpha/beta fold hydrolase [Leptospira sp. GIMC2001]|uniref:alpha/beta fold hydrolase n=1 Tax=Leptospira sp. GIMC2001 TaxID=1513297 RepID=UPI00234ADA89|nr:alpha/beta hydrolase [Leptospira sp. GIMC2001]WCL49152.1 alpha/beta hydrolase [Leptospira sp. GIMC2001]